MVVGCRSKDLGRRPIASRMGFVNLTTEARFRAKNEAGVVATHRLQLQARDDAKRAGLTACGGVEFLFQQGMIRELFQAQLNCLGCQFTGSLREKKTSVKKVRGVFGVHSLSVFLLGHRKSPCEIFAGFFQVTLVQVNCPHHEKG